MKPNSGTILRSSILIAFASLLAVQACIAQVEPWDRVRLIEEGKPVAVALHSGKTVTGKMGKWNAAELSVLRGRNSEVTLAKEDIARVELLTGMSRGRRAAYAGAITGGIIAGLVSLACSYGHCSPSTGVVVLVNAAVYGGGAAGIAALFPQHKERIYRASPPVGPYTGVRLLYAPGEAVKKGAKIRIRFQLSGAGSSNESSFTHVVRAVGVSSASSAAAEAVPLSRDSNPEEYFRFDAGLGPSGGYSYDLNTSGLEPGDYNLSFQIGNDPQNHTVPFKVK